MHLKNLEIQEQTKAKSSRKQRILRLLAEIAVHGINKSNSQFFDIINNSVKINKTLGQTSQNKERDIQINIMGNKQGNITTDGYYKGRF